ncbi:MAG: winged helix-turn-helix domain-containing protein, partial [Acidobacteriota bacterium]
MIDTPENTYKFRGHQIDSRRRLLRDENGEPVSLTPKVFDLLLFLVENAGTVVFKDEIMAAVWPDTIVEESNLTQNISILRRSLGETRGVNDFIATIPGRGYKFVAEVQSSCAEAEIIKSEAINEDVEVTKEPPVAARKSFFWPAIIVGAIVLVAVSIIYLASSNAPRTTAEPAKILAILPFKPLVQESSDEALEMGMTDTLIAKLSNSSGLILRPLSSVRRFRSGDQDPQAAGRELGANAVLDGSIQRSGEKIRVNVRLVDVESGESLWGGTFDDRYTDIFVVQDA